MKANGELSFITAMKDKTWCLDCRNVLHWRGKIKIPANPTCPIGTGAQLDKIASHYTPIVPLARLIRKANSKMSFIGLAKAIPLAGLQQPREKGGEKKTLSLVVINLAGTTYGVNKS
ncbi:hypothetical protein GWJ21_00525 [Bacillus coagulans]|uniref:hypothetical protein n=1 Tax=Heyndrickxia coagulans TaxID=1398 RepID=UPI001378BB20|nr:hypothetical protein [Heyndrickxia coagulans]NCG66490.1 hypothetical protein [Heyndrickxia coagulans]